MAVADADVAHRRRCAGAIEPAAVANDGVVGHQVIEQRVLAGVNEIGDRFEGMSTLDADLGLYFRPAVRLVAIDVGDAVLAGQLGGGDRALVPARPVLVGGNRGNTASDVSRRL